MSNYNPLYEAKFYKHDPRIKKLLADPKTRDMGKYLLVSRKKDAINGLYDVLDGNTMKASKETFKDAEDSLKRFRRENDPKYRTTGIIGPRHNTNLIRLAKAVKDGSFDPVGNDDYSTRRLKRLGKLASKYGKRARNKETRILDIPVLKYH